MPNITKFAVPGSSRLALLILPASSGDGTWALARAASMDTGPARIVLESAPDARILSVLELLSDDPLGPREVRTYGEHELTGDPLRSEVDEVAEWARDVGSHPWAAVDAVRFEDDELCHPRSGEPLDG